MATKPSEPVTGVPDKATPLQPGEPVTVPSAMGATFAERKAAREKAVQDGENKAVTRATTK